MDVNFTGMQNLCAYRTYHANPLCHTDRVIITLNNKGASKDLKNFATVLKEFPNKYDYNVLDFKFKKAENGTYGIFLNSKPFFKFSKFADDWVMKTKELDKNKWHILERTKDLIERISDGNESFAFYSDYLKGKNVPKIFKDVFLSSSLNTDSHAFIEKAHSNERVSTVTTAIVKEMKENMFSDWLLKPRIFIDDIKSVAGFGGETGDDADFSRLIITPTKNNFKKIQAQLKLSDDDFNFPIEKDKLVKKKMIVIDMCYEPLLDPEDQLGFDLNLTDFGLNEEKNLPTAAGLSELLKMIATTKKELPFPRDYLTKRSYNAISEDMMDKGTLQNIVTNQDDYYMIDSSNGAKIVAGRMAEVLDQKINEFYGISKK